MSDYGPKALVLPSPAADWTRAEDLLTVVAHDLSNCLAPVSGRLDLIKRRARRESRADYLEDADNATRNLERLRHMIGDLLDEARLERGLFVIDPRSLDVAALAEEIAERFSGGEVSVRLIRSRHVYACADPRRLQQALENLVGNAVRHSPSGAVVSIEVSRHTWNQQAWAAIRVTDEGPGIEPALMPSLFEPFSRGSGSAGLGLGLYLAHRIAVAHHGTLSVVSVVGKGTSFTLAWPAAADNG
jgi:signal transduction histidine kinase